jgi:hypothetical protein
MTERLLLADLPTDTISTSCNRLVSAENHLIVIVHREIYVFQSVEGT